MRSGSSVILMALAVADTLALVIGTFSGYILRIHHIDFEESVAGCKINRYLKFVLSYNANWLIVVFTIFRVIAVYLPHKASVYCTRKRAYIAVIATVIMCCLMHLDSLIHFTIVPKFNGHGQFVLNVCWFEGARDTFYTYHFRWVMLVTLSFLPFVVLLTGNAMIIYKMIKYNMDRKRMSSENKSNDSQSMTTMLISISLLFFMSQTPGIVISTQKLFSK